MVGLDHSSMALYQALWSQLFAKEKLLPEDPRLQLIEILYSFLRSSEGHIFLNAEQVSMATTTTRHVPYDVLQMNSHFPFDDVEAVLVSKPLEIHACLTLAMSRIANEAHPYLEKSVVLQPMFYNLSHSINFGEVKSSSVGQLVSVEGHVVRTSLSRPLLLHGQFKCPKCKQNNATLFEDGVFCPPVQCSTKKCYNKILEFDRTTVTTTDMQRIRITEIEDLSDGDPRVPRSLDVEVRGDLVGQCFPGDVVRVAGVVKTIQTETQRNFRSGGQRSELRESGLHQLYILANSVTCTKSSGDHSSRNSHTLNKGETLLSDALLTTSGLQHSSASVAAITAQQTLTEFTPDECSMIRKVALSPFCLPLLLHSLCDTIFGHELVKLGLLLGILGGSNFSESRVAAVVSEDRDDGTTDDEQTLHLKILHQLEAADTVSSDAIYNHQSVKVRENIHILVVGDPGLGKSQLLRAAAAVAPRSVYICGNTSTNAGLTVSIYRDASGQNNVEAGALVLADNGICCIDELDKIQCDTHSLLEAMEQQSVSIAKGGIVTSLRSRTAVMAAANPVGGHYNQRKSVSENLKMNSALLSRFDLIFILLDKPDEDNDQMISEHIMGFNDSLFRQQSVSNTGSRKRSWDDMEQAVNDESLAQRLRRQVREVMRRDKQDQSSFKLSHEQLRRYLEYSKRYVHPRLSKAAAKVLQRMYLNMRAGSSASSKQNLPVTTRHLESLIRLAQARARLELRDEVTEQDAADVVQLLQESLLDVFANEVGEIDTSKRGGLSMAKQMKALVNLMNKEATTRGSNIFHHNEIDTLCMKLKLTKQTGELIEVMRTECYVLLKGPKLYQLQSV